MEGARPIHPDKRNSGIHLIPEILWGTEFCQFYETETDRLEIVGSYLKAGLESNEFCIWVTGGPHDVAGAVKAFEKTIPRLKEELDKGRIEIIAWDQWCGQSEKADAERLLARLDHAILRGFEGLRVAYDASPAVIDDPAMTFAVRNVIRRHNITALFSYPRDRFDAAGLMQSIKNHRFALVRNTDRWELIESSEVGPIKDALQRSEEKLHSLFSNMSEGFAYHRIVLDAESKPCDYVFHEVNAAFEKLTGLKAEHIIGKRVTHVLPGIEKDPADWIGKYGQVAMSGEPKQFESYSASLGKWFSISAFSTYKGYFAVTFGDITERKQAEQALRASEQRWAVTLASIGDAVIATDTAGRITFLNKVAEALTGWSMTEASGRPVQEVFHIVNEYTRATVEDPVARVLETGMIVGLANHTVLLRKDGREVPIDDSGAPIRDAEGRILGVVLIFRDISDRKKMEEDLRQLNETLERRVAERTEMAETRTKQLQALAVELIEAEERERRRVAQLLHDDLQQILAAARFQIQAVCSNLPQNTMLANVELLLKESISKSRRLSHELSPAVLHHSGLVAALHWLALQMNEQFGLRIELDVASERQFENAPLKVFMFRAVQELLFNVIKHAGIREARVALGATDEHCIVTVSDRGEGFEPDILDSIGTAAGFGLLSLRERARYIGGSLTIESAPGHGSRFTLMVPLKVAKARELPPAAGETACDYGPVGAGAEKRTRVLFVDDHRVMRQGLIQLLKGQPDIEVVGEAANGREAIEQTRQLKPDVVVMDISMPVMDGIAATRCIKAENPDVRVLGLSMYEDEQLAQKMRQAGAEAFVSKAASSAELLKALYGIALEN